MSKTNNLEQATKYIYNKQNMTELSGTDGNKYYITKDSNAEARSQSDAVSRTGEDIINLNDYADRSGLNIKDNAKAYNYIMKDAVTTLKILKDRGYRLFVLTRTNMGLDMKMSKLQEYFPFMDGAIFLASHEFGDKTLVANDDESILIDDKPETMVGRKHGILFGEYHWNKEARESGEYICAKNWKEVLAQIEKMEDNIDK